MSLTLPDAKYADQTSQALFFRKLLERLRDVPGVASFGIASHLPMGEGGGSGSITIEGYAHDPSVTRPEADFRPVSSGYFSALRIPLLSGRYFDERDEASAEPLVAIIDESLAERFWPGQDPVGKRLRRGGRMSRNPWMTIVGVVRHVKNQGLDRAGRFQLYWPYSQNPYPFASLVVRSRAGIEPRSLATSVEQAVYEVDKEQPVYNVRTMDEVVARSVAQRRMAVVLLAVFAGLAVTLAAVGLYGVVSYTTARRTHEIGIRMALGARGGTILQMVAKRVALLVAAGLGAGIAVALALSRSMSALLFEVRPGDPAVLAAVAVLLGLVALLAAAVPARRAARVDPMVALRHE
jgi:putative ABC transport system permease protein